MNGEIIGLIQAVGFPIAAYLLLYFDLRARIITDIGELKERICRLEDAINGL